MTTVGVRELKAHLSEYLARAKAGEVIVVTDRGEEIATISSSRESHAERKVREMVSSGRWDWSGEKLRPLKGSLPVPKGSVSDLIIEERDEGAARFDRPSQ